MEHRRFIKTQFGTMELIPAPPVPPLTELQKIAWATRLLAERYRPTLGRD